MKESAILRLDSEPDGVLVPHFAHGVGHTVNVLDGALRDAAFSVACKAGDGETRAAVVDGISRTRQVLQSDLLHPVLAIQTDRRIQVIGTIVSDAKLIDECR